jgi:hypothetical protein
MWIVIINNIQYGYETYNDSCNDINRFNVKFDGLFFIRMS